MSARSILLALVAVSWLPEARAQSVAPPRVLFARAAAGDEDAERALLDAGEEAARAAFVDFARAPDTERRVRAHAVLRLGRASEIPAAIEALADPDALVRAECARFLARPELLGERAVERIERLRSLALLDPDLEVRQVAVRAIADVDDERSGTALHELVDELCGAERGLAASVLAASPRGRASAFERLSQAARGAEDPAVYAALLVPCARAAAEDPRGLETAAQRAPFLVGLRHPDDRVREAAGAAIDAHVNRLLTQQEHARALAVLAAFSADGFDPCRSLEQRARIALLEGTRDEEALALARALDAAARSKDSSSAIEWRARAAHLEALAFIARGEPQRAQEPLRRARRFLDDRLGRRAELDGQFGAAAQVRLTFEVASVAVSECGRLLLETLVANEWRDPDSIPRAALEALRTAHRLALEAQRCGWRADVDAPAGFDVVLRSDIGLHELVLDVSRRPTLSADHALVLRRALGRAFATVAPLESLGFEPFATDDRALADPHSDPRRRALLVDALDAQCDQLGSNVSKARRAVMKASIEAPGGAEPEDQRELLDAEFRFRDAVEQRQRVAEGDGGALGALRTPSSFVVWLARALRDEGRAGEARPFLLRARAQLDASEIAHNFFWGVEMTAEIEMMLGGAISDDGDGRAAELELVKAERRLVELESSLKERGASPGTLALVRDQRCAALVSLAVNANVKMHDPEKAVAWFEQAWEIRQDGFMRVLLACYRAREGKTHEARALVRDVTPGPGTYYNLACTWALLGEADTALAYLKRDLETNYPTARALARQRDWARSDPDLESIKHDPRFLALVGSGK